ncbi:aconitate hydratase [Candidatus Magnetoovum chiemensis]|nr:aconitate hydratase [Candidatus Magnetoovum chiemensis]
MAYNIVEKILSSHLVYGELKRGAPIGIKIDEVYTQDATGTMAWLQFEAMNIAKVKVPLAVSYVDHNMMQANHMNPDDHEFLKSAALKYGAYFSKPGNGICHQVNLEKFAAPGKIALGTDSHTPTNGGCAMLAIGVGGLDAATVMAGEPFELTMPDIVQVNLKGTLQRPWCTAMDIILELLRNLTVKGGVGKIFEYGGIGASDLTVPERATITNMGAELGATSSIFPSDDKTLQFLKSQNRQHDWRELKADTNAKYSDTIEINLDELVPLIALPHSPDNVSTVKELEGTKVNQVCIGSCTNSSYQSMRTVAALLKDKSVAKDLDLLINPGSKQVYEMLAADGSIANIIASGARMLEASCGPCIGMGGAPATGNISLRTYNRNFLGRSGNKQAGVYLTSPITCALSAINGSITNPSKDNTNAPITQEPEAYNINENLLIPPTANTNDIALIKGPNIKDVPVKDPLSNEMSITVLLKLADNITTDDIMPAGAKVLPFRSNIPAMSDFVFCNIDPSFSERANKVKTEGGSAVVAGDNYGQGSSREHAALAPMYLGVKAVIAKSFARIHRSNLINFGILPLKFTNKDDYELINKDDKLIITNTINSLTSNQTFTITNDKHTYSITCVTDLNEREKEIVLNGGLLSYLKTKNLQQKR